MWAGTRGRKQELVGGPGESRREGVARRGGDWYHVVRKQLCMGGVREGRGQGEMGTGDTCCVWAGSGRGRGQGRWELAGIGRKDGLKQGDWRRIGKRGGSRENRELAGLEEGGDVGGDCLVGVVFPATAQTCGQARSAHTDRVCPRDPTGHRGGPAGSVVVTPVQRGTQFTKGKSVDAKGCLPKCKQQVSPPVHPFDSGGPHAGPGCLHLRTSFTLLTACPVML